jgi:hypothetical protein
LNKAYLCCITQGSQGKCYNATVAVSAKRNFANVKTAVACEKQGLFGHSYLEVNGLTLMLHKVAHANFPPF